MKASSQAGLAMLQDFVGSNVDQNMATLSACFTHVYRGLVHLIKEIFNPLTHAHGKTCLPHLRGSNKHGPRL